MIHISPTATPELPKSHSSDLYIGVQLLHLQNTNVAPNVPIPTCIYAYCVDKERMIIHKMSIMQTGSWPLTTRHGAARLSCQG